MTEQQVHDFAATPRTGLPKKSRKYYADGRTAEPEQKRRYL
jgi:hypothetical protein